jgi:hypothetical protein
MRSVLSQKAVSAEEHTQYCGKGRVMLVENMHANPISILSVEQQDFAIVLVDIVWGSPVMNPDLGHPPKRN